MEKLPPTRNVLAQLRCGWEFFYLYTAPAVTRLREEQTGEHSVSVSTAPAVTRLREEQTGGHSVSVSMAPADSHNEQSELGLSTAQAGMKRQPSADEALLWRLSTAQAEYFHRKHLITSKNTQGIIFMLFYMRPFSTLIIEERFHTMV